jgi:hypothetical protein
MSQPPELKNEEATANDLSYFGPLALTTDIQNRTDAYDVQLDHQI